MRGFAADNSCHRASTDTFLLLENLWMKEIADCHLYGILDLGYVNPRDVVAMTRALLVCKLQPWPTPLSRCRPFLTVRI